MKRTTFIKSIIGVAFGSLIAKNVISSNNSTRVNKNNNIEEFNFDTLRLIASLGVRKADIVLSVKDYKSLEKSTSDWIYTNSVSHTYYERQAGSNVEQMYVNGCMFNITVKS